MIGSEATSNMLEFLKLFRDFKPILVDGAKLDEHIAGLEQANNSLKAAATAAATIETAQKLLADNQALEEKIAADKADVARAHADLETANDHMRADRADFETQRAALEDHLKKIAIYESELEAREAGIAEHEAKLLEEQAAITATKKLWDDRLKTISTLTGDKDAA